MKKKRLLAVFAAFTVAATMATSLTACNFAGGGDNNDSTGDNTGDSAHTKMTEEEWEEAFANTIAAESYKIDGSFRSVYQGPYGSAFQSPYIVYASSGVVSMYYDGVNSVKYVSRIVTDELAEEPEKSFYYAYYELSDTDVIEYSSANNGCSPDDNVPPSDLWQSKSHAFNTVEEAKDYVKEGVSLSDDLMAKIFKVSADSEAKTLADLYSAFVYNKTTDTYTADLIIASMSDRIGTITLKFKDGKVCHFENEYINYQYLPEDTYMTEEYHNVVEITDYNSTVVTVPQEIKDSVVDNGSGDNPNSGNRKMTEEEWRQAITNSLSAESYMLSVKEKTIYSSGRTIESDVNLFYDGVHGAQYVSVVYTEIDNGIQQQQVGQLYFELVDTDVTAYMQIDDEEWEEVYTITFNTADEALNYIASNDACGPTMAYLLCKEYNVSRPAYAGDEMLLIDLFDVFTYDETTDTYSATLVADYYDNVTFTFKFEDGYLTFIQRDKDINMPYEAESHMTMEISGYNSTVVTIPKEVKNSAVES